MKTRIVFFVLIFCMIFAASCAKPEEPVTIPSADLVEVPPEEFIEEVDDRPAIGIAMAGESLFEKAFVAAALKYTKNKNFRVNIISADGDAEKQCRDLTDLVADGAKVIVLRPVDVDIVGPTVDDLSFQGVPIISLLEPVNGAVVSFSSPDYVEIGKRAAKLCREAAADLKISNPKVFLIEESIESFVMQLMHDGFIQTLTSEKKVNYVGSAHFYPAQYSDLDGFSFDDLGGANIVFTQNAAMAKAVLELAKNAGKKITVVTVGGDKDILERVRVGQIFASVFVGPDYAMRKIFDVAEAILDDPDAKPAKFIELKIGNATPSTVQRLIEQGGDYAEPEDG